MDDFLDHVPRRAAPIPLSHIGVSIYSRKDFLR
jgi:hypothetical protein